MWYAEIAGGEVWFHNGRNDHPVHLILPQGDHTVRVMWDTEETPRWALPVTDPFADTMNLVAMILAILNEPEEP